MQRALRYLKSGPVESTVICISSANEVYIDTILKVLTSITYLIFILILTSRVEQDKNLSNHFDEIITNPAYWESNGLLNIRRRIERDDVQHGCPNDCYPNMCKGEGLNE